VDHLGDAAEVIAQCSAVATIACGNSNHADHAGVGSDYLLNTTGVNHDAVTGMIIVIENETVGAPDLSTMTKYMDSVDGWANSRCGIERTCD
jgi:hypothetical protein